MECVFYGLGISFHRFDADSIHMHQRLKSGQLSVWAMRGKVLLNARVNICVIRADIKAINNVSFLVHVLGR